MKRSIYYMTSGIVALCLTALFLVNGCSRTGQDGKPAGAIVLGGESLITANIIDPTTGKEVTPKPCPEGGCQLFREPNNKILEVADLNIISYQNGTGTQCCVYIEGGGYDLESCIEKPPGMTCRSLGLKRRR